MRRIITGAVASLLLAACTQNSAPPTLGTAIASVQSDLTHAHVVGVARASNWDSAQNAGFDANVAALQRAQKTGDPVVSILSGPVSMQMTGSFTHSGSFTLSSAANSFPSLSITRAVTHGRSQQMTLPVSFIPLSALPNAELAHALSDESVIFGLQGKLQDDVVARERASMLADRDALMNRVTYLVRHFSAGNCPAVPTAPFVGITR